MCVCVCLRSVTLADTARHVSADILNRAVYDLDSLLAQSNSSTNDCHISDVEGEQHQTAEQVRSQCVSDVVDKTSDVDDDILFFESRFECGNLRKAIQV